MNNLNKSCLFIKYNSRNSISAAWSDQYESDLLWYTVCLLGMGEEGRKKEEGEKGRGEWAAAGDTGMLAMMGGGE